MTGEHVRLTLRDYQEQTLERIEAAEARGVRRQLVVAATGLGKTIIFCALAERRGGRALILAHRDELVQQAAAKVREVWPGVEPGIVKAGANDVHAQVVVASVQTLARQRRLDQLTAPWRGGSLLRPADPFGLVVVDECFPAGTMVGGAPIEAVRVGDRVAAFDELSGQVARRRVVRVMRRRPSTLVRLHLSDGATLTVTPDHPMWVGDRWLPAASCAGSNLWRHGVCDLRTASDRNSADVLEGVPVRASGEEATGCSPGRDGSAAPGGLLELRGAVRHQRGGSSPPSPVEETSAGLLLASVPVVACERPVLRPDGCHQPAARVRPDERAEPDEPGGDAPEGVGRLGSYRSSAANPRRERHADPGAATAANGGARGGLGQRACHPDGVPSGEGRDANALQDRHRAPSDPGGGRGGRPLPLRADAPGGGPAQGQISPGPRVDRVEVLEPGSDGRYGGLCPDGHVYNLEVEGAHTYTANGLIVHNCHHATADTYVRILDELDAGKPDGPLLLGVTATPDRGDGKGLDAMFDEVVAAHDMLWGIAAGYLSDLRGLRVTVEHLDLTGVKMNRGDYEAGETGRRLVDAGAPDAIVAAWLEHALGRRTLVFTPTVASAQAVADSFKHVNVRAACVHGGTPLDERRRILSGFATGEVEVVTNCAVLTEGYDEPRADCIVVARPTKSRALYVQMVGRGTRRHPDKTDCLVLDVVGASEHSLVTVPSLFGIENPKLQAQLGDGTRPLSAVVQDDQAEQVRLGRMRAEEIALFTAVRAAGVAWTPVSDPRWPGIKRYQVGLGKDQAGEPLPTVVLAPWDRAATGWVAGLLMPDGSKQVLIADVPMEMAQGVAEDYVRKSGKMALLATDAAWRTRKPSVKAREFAKKLRIRVEPDWNAGQLSDAIDAVLAERKARRARSNTRAG